MFAAAREVRLGAEERAELEALVRAPTTEQRHAFRARIVLMAAEGLGTRAIARALETMPRTVSLWRIRLAEAGIAGLDDRPRPGGRASAKYDATTDRRILEVLEQPPPAGYARWTGGLVAEALGDVSDQYVWRFLRAQKIDLDGRKSWCESHDPDFVAKSAEIIGLYLDPPQGALVLSVDEKPHIQAWSGRRVISGYPTAARSPAVATITSGTAPRRFSRRLTSPAAGCAPATIGGAAASSSLIS
jgi:transposase